MYSSTHAVITFFLRSFVPVAANIRADASREYSELIHPFVRKMTLLLVRKEQK